MLQQTRVEAVIPYFRRFTAAFPDVERLAAAPLEQVLRVWEGLGYYARARNLHRAAREVVARHAGRLPRTAAEWQRLPGIGPYSAAAIASICFGEPCPVVDGNVARVFARFWGIRRDVRAPATRRKLAARLAPHVATAQPGDFNQAVMELGRLVCSPAGPLCPACPLSRWCRARRTGSQARLPVRSPRPALPHHEVVAGVIRRGPRVLIARRPVNALLGGLWEFPGGKRRSGESRPQALRREIREETGIRVRVDAKLATIAHAYTHFRITMHVFECRHISGRARPLKSDAVKWIAPADLETYPFPAANRRISRLLLSACKSRVPPKGCTKAVAGPAAARGTAT